MNPLPLSYLVRSDSFRLTPVGGVVEQIDGRAVEKCGIRSLSLFDWLTCKVIKSVGTVDDSGHSSCQEIPVMPDAFLPRKMVVLPSFAPYGLCGRTPGQKNFGDRLIIRSHRATENTEFFLNFYFSVSPWENPDFKLTFQPRMNTNVHEWILFVHIRG